MEVRISACGCDEEERGEKMSETWSLCAFVFPGLISDSISSCRREEADKSRKGSSRR